MPPKYKICMYCRAVRKRISNEFGEAWGQTDSEARAKMTALVDKWVASQQ